MSLTQQLWQPALYCEKAMACSSTHDTGFEGLNVQCVCVLAQIWWCLTSSTGSKLFAHDLATTTTSELPSFQSGLVPAVTCMQLDSQGYVWMGFKGGMLQVWDADRRACLCQSLHMAPADVRWAVTDQAPSDILQHHQLCFTVGGILTCYTSPCYIVYSSCHRFHLFEQTRSIASSSQVCLSDDAGE